VSHILDVDERKGIPPSELRTDRELLNELGQALGRIEQRISAVLDNQTGTFEKLDFLIGHQRALAENQAAISLWQRSIDEKLHALQARKLLKDFHKNAKRSKGRRK
jgi:hypothetical protein